MDKTVFDMNERLWNNYLPVQDSKKEFDELPVLKLRYGLGADKKTWLVEVVAYFANGQCCDCSTYYDSIDEALEAIRDDYDMMTVFLNRFPYEFSYELAELTQRLPMLCEEAKEATD